MSANAATVRGWVRNGMVYLEPGTTFPEGTEVRVAVVPDAEQAPIPFTPEEAAEFAFWDKLGDEAWAMIDKWEKEDGDAAR